MENLGRGLVAISEGNGRVYVSWRMLEAGPAFNLPTNLVPRPYISIPLRTLPGYTPNDALARDLDGERPSQVMCRGYYTRTVLVAWNRHEGEFTRVWTFDSDDGTPSSAAYRGQGNHSLSVADVADDGRDEILDRNSISKWDWVEGAETCLLIAEGFSSNNGSKSTLALCADIMGDWREEVIWPTRDNRELRIYTTTIPGEHRLRTLMHDPQYRLSVAWQNVAYNQPAQPGFYLGEGMKFPPRPAIKTSVGPPAGQTTKSAATKE